MSKPRVTITYCPGCKWLMRAGWMAQELLSTFEDQLAGVTIAPSDQSGVYRITLDDADGTVLWDRSEDGGFPEIKVLKQRLRDMIAPDQDLGHIDRRR